MCQRSTSHKGHSHNRRGVRTVLLIHLVALPPRVLIAVCDPHRFVVRRDLHKSHQPPAMRSAKPMEPGLYAKPESKFQHQQTARIHCLSCMEARKTHMASQPHTDGNTEL